MSTPQKNQRPATYLLTLKEAAAQTGLSIDTMRRAIKATDVNAFPPPLRAKFVGGAYRIKSSVLDDWIDALPDA